LRQSGSLQPQSPRERTSVSLPPREERRNSFAERRSSRRHSSMHETETVPVEASVEEHVANITAGVRRSSQDAAASPKAKPRPSTTEATPSPKEKRRSLQLPLVEAAHRRQSQSLLEVDGLGIAGPAIQKSKLTTEEEPTPTTTADVDTPSKSGPRSADDDYNEDNDDYSREETGVKEAQGIVEQQDVVAEQNDVPVCSQGDDGDGDGDDDYNDDYNADVQDNDAAKQTREGEQAALDDYLEECY